MDFPFHAWKYINVPERFDKAARNAVKRRANGFASFGATITRTGVFTYTDAAGNARREYRPPDEVFKADSLESFSLVPLTNDHPTSSVTAATAQAVTVGAIADVKPSQDGKHVEATVSVFTEDTISAIESGKVELSCGYTCELEETPGVSPEGERYDAIQRNIVGNHVALVEVGRAGSARLRLDAGAASFEVENNKGINMDELKKALADLVAAQAKLEAVTAEKDKIEGKCDALQAKADAAEKARMDSEGSFNARVTERVSLLATAARFDVSGEALDNDAIRAAVVEKIDGVKVPEGKSREYLQGRFDAAVARAKVADESSEKLKTKVTDAGVSRADAARAKMLEYNRKLVHKNLKEFDGE